MTSTEGSLDKTFRGNKKKITKYLAPVHTFIEAKQHCFSE